MTGYPVGKPIASDWLEARQGNRVWWEESGNPAGIPALILHGGPGSGNAAAYRGFFDPARYRIIGMDQRGSGRSTPHASEDGVDFSVNTTAHLVEDIEALRLARGVKRWVLYGHSWGVTLGLAYAEAYPRNVEAAVFSGVTMTRRREIDWLYRGLGAQLPEAYAAFRAGASAGTPKDRLVEAYNDLMFDAHPAVREKAAFDFHRWEAALILAEPGGAWPARWDDPEYRLSRGRIVTHYFRHAAWLEDGQLLRDAGRLAGIRGTLVQGVLDPQAPEHTAREVAAAWPGAELTLVGGAGHSPSDGGMAEAIAAALDRFATRAS